MTPFAELIEPGAFELRAAQAFGILCGEALRCRAIGPLQTPPRGLPLGPLASMDGEQPRDALHHDIAYIGHGFADEGDAPHGFYCETRQAQREAAHPFGACARLARSAPAHDEPLGPGAAIAGAQRRALIVAAIQFPQGIERGQVCASQARQRLRQPRRIAPRRACEPGQPAAGPGRWQRRRHHGWRRLRLHRGCAPLLRV